MKKILNLVLICSVLTISSASVLAKDKAEQANVNIAKKPEEIQIVKPEKKKKVNKREERRKNAENAKSKKESSKEAEGMYETKFPVINSQIEYADMNGEVTLSDCIKLAITHHPTIMSAISNAEIYKTRIGQAWSNYFPTLNAGTSYSRNDMLMTMGGSYSRMMSQKYNMYYVPTLSANMLLFDFGKTKAAADMAKRNYEASRYDAETSIELVIYNVKVAYYNLIFAEIQKTVYEDTVKDFELQLKQARAQYEIGRKAKIDVTTAEYNLGNAKVNLIKAKNTLELAAAELANAVGIPELEGVVLKDKLNTKAYEVNFKDLLSTAQASRPALLASKKLMDAAEMNVRSAKRAFAPDLSAFGSYNQGGRQIDSDYGYQFGVQLNYSALNLMYLKKQVDEANATYKKYVADYEQQKQNVYLEVKSAYINLLNSHDSLDVSKLALQQAKERQYQAFRRYQVGLGDAIEFKDAENSYLNAQLDYYSNVLNYNVNAAEVERVIGAPIKESDKDL
ncbi:MAG: TolC family protein [Brachyspira sp.]|nr:TolC family protein [Brachyspira sp.]